MSLATWSILHRTFVLLLVLVASAAGLWLSQRLPEGIYPELDFPRIVVVAKKGDSPPDIFESTVTRPLEQRLATTLGLTQVRSKSSRGAAEISLSFNEGTDMWRALQLVQSAVASAQMSLPPGVEIEVERLTPTAFPVVTFNLAGRVDARDLRDLADLVVRPALSRVPGVGQVRVTGGDARQVHVLLDQERVASLHLRSTDVASKLAARLTLAGAGRLELGQTSSSALVSAEPKDLDDLRSVPIAVGPGGGAITLGALADVRDGAADRSVRTGGPHGETVILSASRAEGASTTTVVENLKKAARQVAASLPPGVHLTPVYDQAQLIEESTKSVRDAILLGIFLCLLVLGFSLRNLRVGAVAALVVPTVLACSFGAMAAFGQTLNLMSLGGLAVAVGLVIDDGIIVVESIARHLDQGVSPKEAAEKGTAEMTSAVVGTTITTVIVLVPLALLGGVVGSFLGALAATLAAAVLLSLIVSLTVVPALASRWFVAHPVREKRSLLDDFYGRVASWGAKRRWVGPVLLVLALAACAALAVRVPSGFLPEMDEGAFVLDYFLPAGTSLSETERVVQELERIVVATPQVESYSRRTGAELGPAAATAANRGDIMVRLRSNAQLSTVEVMATLRAQVAQLVPRARVEFVLVLQDVLNDLSGAPHPIEVKLFGPDAHQLETLSEEVAQRLAQVPGVVDLYGGVDPPATEAIFALDRDKLAQVHRAPRDVLDELHLAVSGAIVGSLRQLDQQIPIVVRSPNHVRYEPQALTQLPLFADTVTGGLALGAVAPLRRARLTSELYREDLQPVVTISAAVAGRDLGSVDEDIAKALATVSLPAGVRLVFAGQAASQKQAFGRMLGVAALGLLLILLVLTAQFRDLRPSLAVLATTPFAVLGAFVALWVAQVPLDVSSLMGFILLVGLEVKSGILLLEYAQERVRQGAPPVAAVVEAGRRRIRPIMLTTTATLFGVLPLALGVGAGTDVLRPLAIAVLGGLLVSKFSNLVALPSLAVAFGFSKSS